MINLKEHLDIFVDERLSLKNNNKDPLLLGVLLESEMHEFLIAFIDYLAHPNQDTAQELAQEAADVGLFLEQIMRMIGSNLFTEMIDKVTYNTTRFHAGEFKRKDYKTAYAESKAQTKAIGWKETYYQEPHIIYDHSTALNYQ